MSVTTGPKYKAIVVSTELEQDQKQQTYIKATFQVEDETHSKRIYVTTNNANSQETVTRMCRAQLKAMGFDCDTQSLKEIDANPLLLVNNEVEVDFKTWDSPKDGPVLQLNGIYGKKIPKTDDFLSNLDSALRGAKSEEKPPTRKKAAPAVKPPPTEKPPAEAKPEDDGGIPF